MHPLQKHITQFILIQPTEFDSIFRFFNTYTTSKKEVLQEGNSLCKHSYFVVEGCIHMYFISQNGTKRTVQFAIENWWITDFLAFYHQKPTEFYIEAVEKSEILSISYNNQQKLFENFPLLESYFRQVYQIAYGASLIKSKYLFDFSKEEMYLHFITNFPEFAQRVPQYLIASFLGLTPEYVSEIRRKMLS